MPFWEQEVKIPAVNYRGARKIGGAKTRGRSVERGTDIPKMERIIGNTRQARQVKASRAAVLPLLYCSHTTNTPFKASVYAVLQQLLSQFVANLSLISCLPAMVRTCWRRPSPAVQNEAYSRYLPAVLPRKIPNTMAEVCTV